MAQHVPIDIDLARRHLEVSEQSPSGLVWVAPRARRCKPGDPAGTLQPHGYWRVVLNSKRLWAHRVVWALTHGEDPGDALIDHVDGNGLNNAPENLRLADKRRNAANWHAAPRGRSRFRGVDWHKASNLWRARYRGRSYGYHHCETAAALARDRAARLDGARLNFP